MGAGGTGALIDQSKRNAVVEDGMALGDEITAVEGRCTDWLSLTGSFAYDALMHPTGRAEGTQCKNVKMIIVWLTSSNTALTYVSSLLSSGVGSLQQLQLKSPKSNFE